MKKIILDDEGKISLNHMNSERYLIERKKAQPVHPADHRGCSRQEERWEML
jgi:hypothetical protein